MNNKSKKYKLVKSGIAIGLSFVIAGSAATLHNHSKKMSTYKGANSTTYADYDSGYLDVDFTNEKAASSEKIKNNFLNINNSQCSELLSIINDSNYDYKYSKYYNIDETLNKMNNSKSYKQKSNGLIKNNRIDTDELFDLVLTNNKNYMNQKTNSINSFYSEASSGDIKKICELISEIYSNSKKTYDIEMLDNTLRKLKIFQNNTSVANAYVSDDMTFVFNPNMLDLFSNMQEMRGNSEDGVDITETVFVHEIEHIFQNSSNDFNEDNGLEVGFCRKFNNVKVNSLWYSWLLEGSAELRMSQELNTTPKNYDKKISYINSYNLSRLFDDDYNNNDIVDTTFTNSIDEAFEKLGINSNTDKDELLKLLYSIEITQGDVSDFVSYIEENEKIKFTEEEKNQVKMEIRCDVIKNLSKSYYTGLVSKLKSQKITDLNTLFYLLRLWELDCYNHLNYTKEDEFESAKDFIIWENEIMNSFFEIISKSNNITFDEVTKKYNNYKMTTEIQSNKKINANLNFINKNKLKNLEKIYDNYSTSYFSRVSTMNDYIKGLNYKI